MNKAVYNFFMNLKQGHRKLDRVEYKQFEIQSYLTTKTLNNEEKLLLFNLRSNCHSSKANFRKLNKNNLTCSFNCPNIEDQLHSFTICRPILSQVQDAYSPQYQNIFGTLEDQMKTIKIFSPIEERKKQDIV